MAADFSAVLAFSTSAGSPPAIRYRSPPIVRNKVATAARIPTTQAVVLLITWAIEVAARTVPWLASAGTATAPAGRLARLHRAARRGRLLPHRRPGRAGMSLMAV